MKTVILLSVFLLSSSTMASAIYSCVFKHTDTSAILHETTEINHEFELSSGQTKYINFPLASRKQLMISIYEFDSVDSGLSYSLSARVFRNEKSSKQGEILESEAVRNEMNVLMSAAYTMENLNNRISLVYSGSWYEANNSFKVNCLRK